MKIYYPGSTPALRVSLSLSLLSLLLMCAMQGHATDASFPEEEAEVTVRGNVSDFFLGSYHLKMMAAIEEELEAKKSTLFPKPFELREVLEVVQNVREKICVQHYPIHLMYWGGASFILFALCSFLFLPKAVRLKSSWSSLSPEKKEDKALVVTSVTIFILLPATLFFLKFFYDLIRMDTSNCTFSKTQKERGALIAQYFTIKPNLPHVVKSNCSYWLHRGGKSEVVTSYIQRAAYHQILPPIHPTFADALTVCGRELWKQQLLRHLPGVAAPSKEGATPPIEPPYIPLQGKAELDGLHELLLKLGREKLRVEILPLPEDPFQLVEWRDIIDLWSDPNHHLHERIVFIVVLPEGLSAEDARDLATALSLFDMVEVEKDLERAFQKQIEQNQSASYDIAIARAISQSIHQAKKKKLDQAYDAEIEALGEWGNTRRYGHRGMADFIFVGKGDTPPAALKFYLTRLQLPAGSLAPA